ncbi:MAG: hypothetical protein O3C60_17060, partial [Planctomycetota bacterium]|nr:hypothetical protein [Planctomycetota bacterium]
MNRWGLLLFVGALGCQGANSGLPPLAGRGATRIPPLPTGALGSGTLGYERPGDFRAPQEIPRLPSSSTSWLNTPETIAPRRTAVEPTQASGTRVASTPVRPPAGNTPPPSEDGNLTWRNPVDSYTPDFSSPAG